MGPDTDVSGIIRLMLAGLAQDDERFTDVYDALYGRQERHEREVADLVASMTAMASPLERE